MNLFSTALDGLGRWYVAVPPFLIMMFLAALLLVTETGQTRLRDDGERLENATTRRLRIDELERALIQSVNAQRSFLLTGDKSYLTRYENDRAEIEPRLEQLHQAYADLKDAGPDIRNLQILIGKRLADLGIVLDIQQKQGTPAAVSLIETSVGSDTGLAISDILQKMRSREIAAHTRAAQKWFGSLSLSRWITSACTVVNILLVVVATRLVYADVRRRSLLTAELRDQEILSTHLQSLRRTRESQPCTRIA